MAPTSKNLKRNNVKASHGPVLTSSSAKKAKLPTTGLVEDGATNKARTALGDNEPYEALSLADVRERVLSLCDRVPSVPPGGLSTNEQILGFATALQSTLEEFSLLCGCVNAATYTWGTERSGAADQNLSLLSNEMTNSQEQLNSVVTPRLTNVLSPVVDIVVDKIVTTTSSLPSGIEEKTKQQYFVSKTVDPDFVQLCRQSLCRNAPMIRQVTLSHLYKMHICIGDYLEAKRKDNSHISHFAY